MEISLSWPQVLAFVAFVAMVAPALMGIGYVMSRLNTHERRLDRADERFRALEVLLRDELRLTRKELTQALENAWRNCPLAKGDHTT